MRSEAKEEKPSELRNQLPGYYRRTEEEFELLWSEGLFVLDANVLLNLYRYPEETRSKLLNILREIQDRLSIPHQVAEEFHRGRLSVIRRQKKAYSQVRNTLNQGRKEVEHQITTVHRTSAIESEELLKRVRESFEELNAEVEKLERKSAMKDIEESNSPDEDEIWQAVIEILDSRVGEQFSPERKEEIFKEGERRYASEVPPGYKDVGNRSKPGDQQFGDLVLWFEIIEKAREVRKPIVFVTDERKADWWQTSGSNMVGPRPELTNEINQKAGVLFHMYSPAGFMKWAGSHLQQEISEETLEDVEELPPLGESFVNLLSKVQEVFSRTYDTATTFSAAEVVERADESLRRAYEVEEELKRIRDSASIESVRHRAQEDLNRAYEAEIELNRIKEGKKLAEVARTAGEDLQRINEITKQLERIDPY